MGLKENVPYIKITFLLSFIRGLARFPLLKRAIPIHIVRLLLVLQIISLRVFKIIYYILYMDKAILLCT